MSEQSALRIIIVDDEAPARMRLKDVLGDIASEHPHQLIGFAANGVEALRLYQAEGAHLVLTDIHMPLMDGIELARHFQKLETPPLLVFTTAYDEYAIQAFELAAIDYLLKPVRAKRLSEALNKVRRQLPIPPEVLRTLSVQRRQFFSCTERGRVLLVPVNEVLFLRSELKYVTAHTTERVFLFDESLAQLEQEFADLFLRIHRNCLVLRQAITGVERAAAGSENEGHWQVLLRGMNERLTISRRQWPLVRQVLKS